MVLVVEMLGVTSVLPYGAMLLFYTDSTGSEGLPADNGRNLLPTTKRFSVHILVPCYKVSRCTTAPAPSFDKAYVYVMWATSHLPSHPLTANRKVLKP